MARSLNRIQLIGNLTRDPELRYTPNGTGVCSFGLATNRSWTSDNGEKHEETEFHNIVAWNKLAELCSQFLLKGRKVYVEGRIATRSWTAQDGTQKSRVEIIINDMILLDQRRPSEESVSQTHESKEEKPEVSKTQTKKIAEKEEKKEEKKNTEDNQKEETVKSEDEVPLDDIPF